MAVLTAGTEPLDMERLLGTATQIPTTEAGRLLLSVALPEAGEALLDFRGSFGSVDGSFVGDLETLTASGALDYTVTDIGFSFATLIDLSDPEDPFAVDRAIFGGPDTLIGSAGDDTVVLYGGTDSVEGGDGTDTAVILDSVERFDIARPEPGLTTVVGPGLSASLRDIEFLRFNDALIDLDAFFRTATVELLPPAEIAEGGPDNSGQVTFRVDLAEPAPAGGLAVDFALGGTAVPGEDFIPPGQPALTVPAGTQSAELTVALIGDTLPEADETLVLTLEPGEGYRLDPAQTISATAIIIDDEPDQLSIAVTPLEAMEGTEPGDGASFAFTITRSDPAGGRSVMLGFDFGPGMESADFADGALPAGRTVTFADGQAEATIVVAVAPDGLDEMDEVFTGLLSAPDGGATIDPDAAGATATIRDDDRPDVLAIASAPVTAREGTVPEEGAVFTITVTRDNPAGERTVALDFAFGAGVTGEDFADGQLPAARTVSFVDGQAEATIAIAIAPDGLAEEDETVTASLSDPDGGAGIAPDAGSTTFTIQDDDRVDVLSVSLAPDAVMEGTAPEDGGVFTVTVARGNPIGERSVTLDFAFGEGVSAADFADGALPEDRLLTFADGEATQSLSLVLAADAEIEADETITVSLAEPSGDAEIDPAAGSATGTILNDDGELDILSLDAAPRRAAEGTGSGDGAVFTVTVSRSNAEGPRSVELDFAFGTGINGADFVGGRLPAGRTLNFEDGQGTATATLAINPDSLVEADETITVSIANPDAGGTIDPDADTALVTIANDDATDVLSVDIEPAAADEGTEAGEGAVFTVTVARSNPAGLRSVNAEFAFGSGITASDFASGALPADRTVTFLDGQAQASFTVTVDPDDVTEANETFTVSLAGPSGTAAIDPSAAQATATIRNDDAAPELFSIAINPSQAVEGSGGGDGAVFAIEVSRTAATEPRSVTMAFDFGAGLNDADFVDGLPQSRTLTFAAGQRTITLEAEVEPDFLVEDNESFTAVLTGPSAGALINPAAASDTATILNDDTVQIGVEIVPVSDQEGTAPEAGAVFTVLVSRNVSDGTQTVDLDFSFGAGVDAADFLDEALPQDRTVTFADGVASVAIEVAINPDATVEGNELFTATLSNASGGAGIDPGQASATILNDDVEMLSISVEPAAVLEGSPDTIGGGAFTFEILRSSTAGARAVDLAFDFGTGVDAADFVDGLPADRTVTFADGEALATFSVEVNPDFLVEADETFTAMLENPDGMAVIDPGQGSATATILNDDLDILSVAIDPPSEVEGTGSEEGAVFSVTVVRSNSAGPRTVDVAFEFGAGVTADDFLSGMLPADRTVSFADGQGTASFAVDIEPDALPELDETFLVRLENPDAGAEIHPVTDAASALIIDDDEPDVLAVAIDPPSEIEGTGTGNGASFSVMVARSNSAGPRTVDLQFNFGEGVTADDFLNGVLPEDRTVSFADGQSVASFAVDIEPDSLIEPDETFAVELTNPDGGAMLDPMAGSASATIVDDDELDVLFLAVTPDSVIEGTQTPAQVTFTITRLLPDSGPRNFDLRLLSATSEADADDFGSVISPDTTIQIDAVALAVAGVIPDGQAMATIIVTNVPDAVPEPDESADFVLTTPDTGEAEVDPANSVATVTVVNDDNDVLSIDVSPSSDAEGTGNFGASFVFTIARSNPNGDRSVDVDFSFFTGVNAADFAAISLPAGRTVTFDNGEALQSFTVGIQPDTVPELDEIFAVELVNPSAGATVNPMLGVSSATILDDDASVFSIDVEPASQDEGTGLDFPNSFDFTISRTNPNNAASVNLSFIFGEDVDGADFSDEELPAGQTLNFENGQSETVISVEIDADGGFELNEEFSAVLSNPTNLATLDPMASTATATIVNDDAAIVDLFLA